VNGLPDFTERPALANLLGYFMIEIGDINMGSYHDALADGDGKMTVDDGIKIDEKMRPDS
jgi:hypothetical protein